MINQKLTLASLKVFWQYLTPWWGSSEKKMAWLGVLGLLALSFGSVYIGVLFNEWSKDFYNALEKKNLQDFYRLIGVFGIILPILLFEFCARQYLVTWMSFRWRRWMTQELQQKWLFSKGYYSVPLKTDALDNPDQRISQDINAICTQALSLFMLFFREGINFITFSIILWGISSHLAFPFGGETYQFPGLLLWAALLYALIGMIFILKVGTPLIKLDRKQERLEANFRFRLMRIFERREEVATLGGEAFENFRLLDSFKDLTKNYYSILKQTIYINLFQNFYLNGSVFIPLFIVGPLYFSGLITFGVLMQIRGMFREVENSLSVIVMHFPSIANVIASLQRYIMFHDHIDETQSEIHAHPPTPSTRIDVSGLSIFSPQGDTICLSPEISLKAGERKVFMGPSGCGKTSLLRVLSGLYPHYKVGGALQLPSNMMFVPQRPYMPLGTLRQCLAYPAETCGDDILLPLMKACLLEHLIPQLDIHREFQQSLSLGEQQRVNFVRVLLQKPSWLIMDEPTSQLNDSFEKELCHLLVTALPLTGIMIITHRKLPFFETVIQAHKPSEKP